MSFSQDLRPHQAKRLWDSRPWLVVAPFSPKIVPVNRQHADHVAKVSSQQTTDITASTIIDNDNNAAKLIEETKGDKIPTQLMQLRRQ
jgi:hypothetical protein